MKFKVKSLNIWTLNKSSGFEVHTSLMLLFSSGKNLFQIEEAHEHFLDCQLFIFFHLDHPFCAFYLLAQVKTDFRIFAKFLSSCNEAVSGQIRSCRYNRILSWYQTESSWQASLFDGESPFMIWRKFSGPLLFKTLWRRSRIMPYKFFFKLHNFGIQRNADTLKSKLFELLS